MEGRTDRQVSFDQFKDVFVSVLSCSLDFSQSEDDSSYLEPVIPEEVKPKFVKGTKRYGRRSKPDSALGGGDDSEDSSTSRTRALDSSPSGVRKAKLRRAASLESVESLKSDDEAGGHRDVLFQNKGDQEEDRGGGGGGGQLLHLHIEEVDVLLGKLDADVDGRVSIRKFREVLCGSAPFSCSTPLRTAHQQRAPLTVQEDGSVRSASPSLLTPAVGQKVLSRLDDGSGWTSPERVVGLWTEEGIRNSRDILKALDFPPEERLSLTDLTLALDNELLVSGSAIQQAALISYKSEVQHLLEVLDQACRERDKVKADLDQADLRNLQLVREVDDRHASMEMLNQSRIRELELDFRERLTSLRGGWQQEKEELLQQVEVERGALQEELEQLRGREEELQEELRSTVQENAHLDEELTTLRAKLRHAEAAAVRLQTDLDLVLQDKFGGLDAVGEADGHDRQVSEVLRDYEQQCRELRDRNDELNSELELLKSRRRKRKSMGAHGRNHENHYHGDGSHALTWKHQQQEESESDDSDLKRHSIPTLRKTLQPDDTTALPSLADVRGLAVSIETELELEKLKAVHEEELQQLHIDMDTQVNYYERSLEMMRKSMEVERKDIAQAFKLEISELEEQKRQAEQQVKQLKENLEQLQTLVHTGGGGGWSSEQERRMQRERAEMEQNFAREISNLVGRLSAEKEQLEAELKLRADQEVMVVRKNVEEWCEEQVRHLKEQVCGLQEALQKSRESEAHLNEDLEESRRRCSELEEVHTQMEECVSFLEAQELQNRRLEEELRTVRSREEQLLEETSLMKEELGELQAATHNLLQDHQLVTRQEETVGSLRVELEERQEALKEERTRTFQLRAGLEEHQKEVKRLNLEKQTYALLAEQLSSQIVEMEEEIHSLRDLLRDLSSQLNGTADLVLNLRCQLNDKAGEEKERVLRLERDLQDSQSRLSTTEEEFGREKRRMKERLEELERLVLDLEETVYPGRTQLEEVRSENGALQDRLNLLQQEVYSLEDDVSKKRRRLEELEREHRRSREEEERLYKENSKYREEVLDLSGRNLQLSNDNAELNARLHGDQKSVRILQERLATVTSEKETTVEMVEQVRTSWSQEKVELQKEVERWKEQLSGQTALQQRLTSVTEKLQKVEGENGELLRNANERNRKVEQLQKKVESLEVEAELLRSQLFTVTEEKLGHAQEVTELRKTLQDARAKLSEVQDLRTRLKVMEDAHVQDQNQADITLGLLQVQHERQLWRLQEQTGEERREQEEELRERLEEELRRSGRLEEELRKSQQSSSQISIKQVDTRRRLWQLQQQIQDLDTKTEGGPPGPAGEGPGAQRTADEECQAERSAEGRVPGERSADGGTAGHRAAAETGGEEEHPAGGEGRGPQRSAEGGCGCLTCYMTKCTARIGWFNGGAWPVL
ncbi:ninein-like protein isoform 2-T2 [Pholidichthys leucotaenia]